MKKNSKPNWSKRFLIALGLFIGLFVVTDVRAQKLDNTLLWKVEGDDIQTSYLFGTFHMLPQADFVLKEKVKKAFNQAEKVVMELDFDDPNMQSEMMKNIQMKGGVTLDQLMSKEDLEILNSQLQEAAGLTTAQVNTFKPFMVETFLLPTFIEGTPASYEITFVQMTMNKSVPIEGLEEVAEQVNVFDEISYENQVEDLLDILKNKKKMKRLLRKMIVLYKKENIRKLYSKSKNYFNENEIELLLHNRNANWIERIANHSKEKSTFFAVGAGHLGGDKGVVKLLKKAGYTVSPVFD
ncbi:TraB/GumN family protein [Ekhidna sp.]